LALNFCEKAEIELEKWDLLCYTYINFSLYFKRLRDTAKSLEVIQRAHEISIKKKARTFIGKIYLDKGALMISLNNYVEGEMYSAKAVERIFKQHIQLLRAGADSSRLSDVSKELVIANFNLGYCQGMKGQYQDGILTMKKALKIYANSDVKNEQIKKRIEEEITKFKETEQAKRIGNLKPNIPIIEIYGINSKRLTKYHQWLTIVKKENT